MDNSKLVDCEFEEVTLVCKSFVDILLDEGRLVRELHEQESRESACLVTTDFIDPSATTGKDWLGGSGLEGDLGGRVLNALRWIVPGRVDNSEFGVVAMRVPWVGMSVVLVPTMTVVVVADRRLLRGGRMVGLLRSVLGVG